MLAGHPENCALVEDLHEAFVEDTGFRVCVRVVLAEDVLELLALAFSEAACDAASAVLSLVAMD